MALNVFLTLRTVNGKQMAPRSNHTLLDLSLKLLPQLLTLHVLRQQDFQQLHIVANCLREHHLQQAHPKLDVHSLRLPARPAHRLNRRTRHDVCHANSAQKPQLGLICLAAEVKKGAEVSLFSYPHQHRNRPVPSP